jgi:Phage Tail Protein X
MSCSQFIKHITSNTERWDLLAWNYYGDPTLFGPIVMANPDVPIEAVFEAGRTILIPVIQQPSTTAANLPPWKQATRS